LLGASGAKRNLSELYEKLSEAPFKLKKGFLEFWIPIFLLANKEDFCSIPYGKWIYTVSR